MVAQNLSSFEMSTPELFNVLDANLQAMNNYLPQAYSGGATLLWSQYQSLYLDRYPVLGWDKLVTGEIETQAIPGEHLSLMKEPYVGVIAEKLKLCIDRIDIN